MHYIVEKVFAIPLDSQLTRVSHIRDTAALSVLDMFFVITIAMTNISGSSYRKYQATKEMGNGPEENHCSQCPRYELSLSTNFAVDTRHNASRFLCSELMASA